MAKKGLPLLWHVREIVPQRDLPHVAGCVIACHKRSMGAIGGDAEYDMFVEGDV